MTSLTKNMTIAAAALLVAAGMAGAATIRAEVPFGFQANGSMMPAGSYSVEATSLPSGSPMLRLTNDNTQRSVIATPYVQDKQRGGEAQASLTFECSDAGCALVRVAPGTGQRYQIWRPKTGRDTRIAVIRAVLVR